MPEKAAFFHFYSAFCFIPREISGLGVRVPGLPAQVVAKAAEELEEDLVAMAGARRPEGLVLEGLDDISSEPAVQFGWCRHHKTIVSLEIS
jgi:hypothetical protein